MSTSAPRPLEKWLKRRCLAEVVALRAGDTVLVVGDAPELVTHLERREVTVTVVPASVLHDPGGLPLGSGTVDHLIAADRWNDEPAALAEFARVIAPGGTLVLGGRSRARAPANTGAWTVRRARVSLAAAGLENVIVYGVRNRLNALRFLAPLDDPAALRWFMRSVFIPSTVRGAVAVRVFAGGPLLAVTKLLFVDVVLVARRSQAAL